MTYEELTGNRAMNDYDADKVHRDEDQWWKKEKRSAIHISSTAPGMKKDEIYQKSTKNEAGG